MTRRRVDFEGAWHHVMNRGSSRRDVFRTSGDGIEFLDLVGEWSERKRVEIHAYCLMSNHFHLLVRSTEGTLGDFMQQLQARFTQSINRRTGHDGAIFRGRFHSTLVDDDVYLAVAGRYIHRNPIDVRPPVPLDRYRWSSYRAYLGDHQPSWLRTEVLLDRHGGDLHAFRRFVEGTPDAGPTEDGQLHPTSDAIPVDALLGILSTCIAEMSDAVDGDVVRLERLLATALIDRVGADTAAAIVGRLGFPSLGALRTARYRARERIANDHTLARILDRADRLAA